MVARIEHLRAVKILDQIKKLQTEHDQLTEWLHSESIKPYTKRFLFTTEQNAIDKIERLKKRIKKLDEWHFELLMKLLIQYELD